MVLIIGGQAQGKKDYAKSILGYLNISCGETMSYCSVKDATTISNLNSLIKRMIKDGISQDSIYSYIESFHGECIICDEVGSGVISIDPQERYYVELTGRICCNLAQKCDTVIRIFAGIATRIKG